MKLYSRVAGIMLNDTIMLRNWKYLVPILGIAVIFSGCTMTTKMGIKLDDNSVKQIKNGMTTKNDVIQLLGKSTDRRTVGGIETWDYSYNESDNSPKAANFIPLVGWAVGGAEGTRRSQSLHIQFKDDVVATCTYIKSNAKIDMGGAIDLHSSTVMDSVVQTDCEKAE